MPAKACTITLPSGLRQKAAQYKVNISQAASIAVGRIVRKKEHDLWKSLISVGVKYDGNCSD